jgi:DNA-binding NarL/FixJ family response regulator
MPGGSSSDSRGGAPVLLIGAKGPLAEALAALRAAGVEHLHCASPRTASQQSYEPGAFVLCAQELSRTRLGELRALRERFPGCPAIVIAPRLQRWELRGLLAAGVAGVLLTDRQLPERLLACLQATAAGQLCVPLEHQASVAPAALSAREKQTLGLVVMGYMNCQIADRLFLAESTVKSHLCSAYAKLGVRSRNEAARLILDPEQGLGTGILALSSARAAATAAQRHDAAAAIQSPASS